MLVVNNDLPVKTVAELIAHAKANPGKLSYALGRHRLDAASWPPSSSSAPPVSTSCMCPTRARRRPRTDLIGGQVQMMIGPVVAVLPLAQAGKLRALAVASSKRSALAPDLPTMAESGVPGFEITSWYGLAAPAGTPTAVIARLNAEIGKAMQSSDVVAQFRLQGYEPCCSTPDEMSARIKTEIATLDQDHPRRRHPAAIDQTWTRTSKPTR